MEAKDLLIADLEHFAESMARNEDVGEKRLTYFVSLLTAVAAGLTALAIAAGEGKIKDELFRTAAGTAIAILLIIGLLSYVRMIHRNRVTDEYQDVLKYIRQKYAMLCPQLGEYRLPLRPKTGSSRWLRGGYGETFAVMDGMLLGAFLVLARRVDPLPASVAAVALALVLWWYVGQRTKQP